AARVGAGMGARSLGDDRARVRARRRVCRLARAVRGALSGLRRDEPEPHQRALPARPLRRARHRDADRAVERLRDRRGTDRAAGLAVPAGGRDAVPLGAGRARLSRRIALRRGGHRRRVDDVPRLRRIPPAPPALRAGAERRGRAAEPGDEGAAAPAGPREDRAWLTGATRSRARRATTDRRRAPTARRPRAWTGIRRNRSSGGSISSAGSSTPPGRSRSTTTAAATARWWTGSLRAAGRSRVTGFAPRPSTS